MCLLAAKNLFQTENNNVDYEVGGATEQDEYTINISTAYLLQPTNFNIILPVTLGITSRNFLHVLRLKCVYAFLTPTTRSMNSVLLTVYPTTGHTDHDPDPLPSISRRHNLSEIQINMDLIRIFVSPNNRFPKGLKAKSLYAFICLQDSTCYTSSPTLPLRFHSLKTKSVVKPFAA